MLRKHHLIVTVSALAAAALAGGFVWAMTLPTGFCGFHPPPSGWIIAALGGFAFLGCLSAAIALSAEQERTGARWLLTAVCVAESAAAIGLAAYLASKFAHAYDCG